MAGLSSVPRTIPSPTVSPSDAPAPTDTADTTDTTVPISTSPTSAPPADTPVSSAAIAIPAQKLPADQKKDRKPRRERLPLPDPIPDLPVKSYPEPSKTALQARVAEEDAKLQQCFDRLNSTRAFYDHRQKIRDAGKPAFDAARKVFNDLNDHCRALFEERKDLSNKLKDIKDADIAARSAANAASNDLVGAGKDGAEALKGLRTMEELDARIHDLEYRLETGSFSILEEKKIVAQISFLNHKGRDFISGRDKSYKDEKAAKDHRIASRKELEDARNKQDALIDAAKAKLEEQKKVVDDVRAQQEAQIKELQGTTSDIDRDAEKKKIGEIKAVVRKLRDDFQDELDKWYLNERIHYEQQKIAKRKKYEAAQAERDARRKAWEAEQAQYPEPDPYQEQKDMCSGLTVYMQTLLGETVEKPSVNLAPEKSGAPPPPTLKTASNTREITAEGKAIGKSTVANDSGFESLAFSDFVKKSGNKSKNKKGRRSAGPATDASAEAQDLSLKPHSIDYIAAFTELGIKPPNKISEVRAALEAVKAKKAYYDSKPKPTDEEKAKMAANKSKKQSTPASEKKPKSNGVDLINGDGGAAAFPVLLAENTAPGSSPAPRDISGPSFMAVASGAASAPPPMPAISPADMPTMGAVGSQAVVGGVEAIVVDDPVRDGSIVAPPNASLTEA